MAVATRPDVYVTESLRTGVRSSAARGVRPVGTFVGESWKGPDTEPVLIESWTDYQKIFGGFNSSLADGLPTLAYAVHQFFVQGGSICYVQRVTDGAAVAGSITVPDRAATPDDTLRIDSISKGAWANGLNIGISDTGGATSGHFDLIVYNGSAVDANIVERFTDLSMDPAAQRYAPAIINSETRGSAYIRVADLSSATTAPDNAPLAGPYTLAGGANGGAVDDADFTAAIDRLDAVQLPMVVNVPGNTDADVLSALVAFCEGRGDCFAVLDTVQGDTPAEAVTFAGTISPASSYAAAYWPWLIVPDPSTTRAGSTLELPPGPAVVGIYSRIDQARGPQKTPAGADAVLRNAVGLVTEATQDELGDLNMGSVNAIRQFPGQGLAIMGGRTMQLTGSARYINIRRSLIFIKDTLSEILQFVLFENNDEVLWAAASNEVDQVLRAFWGNGGLKGATAQEAYFIKCDGENNPQQAIEEGEFHMEVGVALQYPAEFVFLHIGQFESGAVTVTEV